MENASKALIIAGGMLIALLIIASLVLMFNQIGGYERAQTTGTKNAQLAQFNLDFEKYVDESGIKGADVISLVNKIVDYNKKSGKAGTKNAVVDYDKKITLNINLKDMSNNVFTQKNYIIDSNQMENSQFYSDIKEYSNLETQIRVKKYEVISNKLPKHK